MASPTLPVVPPTLKSPNATCATCRFWLADAEGLFANEHGICRRNPPVTDRGWPRSAHYSWCGEFAA